ncbi:MAG: PilN domain-containing protein, partial [Gemmatimonadota bacterium]
MIEINLLPGAKRRRSRRRGRSFSLPSLKDLPGVDRWIAFVVAAWIVGPLVTGWLFFDARDTRADLRVDIDRSVQDSTRLAGEIARVERMEAQRDTIAEKLQVIEEVDADRYIWVHIMDEVARALPDYTWLTDLRHADSQPLPEFRVRGYTATTFALTRYMTQLEASPFIRNVTLASTELVYH